MYLLRCPSSLRLKRLPFGLIFKTQNLHKMNDIGLFASEINNFIFSSLRSKDHTQIGGIQIWRTFRYSNNRVFLSFQKEYDGRQEPVAVLRMIIIAFAAYILNYLRRFWALTVPDNPAACLHWTSKVMLSERPGPDGGGGGSWYKFMKCLHQSWQITAGPAPIGAIPAARSRPGRWDIGFAAY